MKKVFLFILTFYYFFVDPFLFSSCRFYPTCSIYMNDAIFKYNVFFALFLCFFRILRCNKFFYGGYNPIL